MKEKERRSAAKFLNIPSLRHAEITNLSLIKDPKILKELGMSSQKIFE